MDNTIKVFVENANGELVIRTGEAIKVLDPKPPIKTDISGVLRTPLDYLEKRVLLIDQHEARVHWSTEEKLIMLITSESDEYTKGKILGKLNLHEEAILWKINKGFEFDNFQLSDLIKMNRSAFASNEEAMKLVSLLKNFQTKISGEIEAKNDGKGNIKALRSQLVQSNLPDSFDITIGIFKGYPKQKINVEVIVNAETFDCRLESPQFKEYMDKITETAIADVLTGIKAIAPNIAIIEY